MDKIIPFAHKLLQEVVDSNSVTVDMTCGNGFDTLFLAEISKKVYAFDIQDAAIENTLKKVRDFNNCEVIKDSHDNILNYIDEPVKGAIYNLGYLPTGDKSITTTSDVTISSLKKILQLLDIKGRIIVVCYPGCSSGLDESIKLGEFLSSFDQKRYSVITYRFINQINNPPFIYAIERDK